MKTEGAALMLFGSFVLFLGLGAIFGANALAEGGVLEFLGIVVFRRGMRSWRKRV